MLTLAFNFNKKLINLLDRFFIYFRVQSDSMKNFQSKVVELSDRISI